MKDIKKLYALHLSSIFNCYMIISFIVVLSSLFSVVLWGFLYFLVLIFWLSFGLLTLGFFFFDETYANIPNTFSDYQTEIMKYLPNICLIALITCIVCAILSFVCLLSDVKNNKNKLIVTSIIAILSIIGLVIILL